MEEKLPVQIFIFQFKVRPQNGFHLTIKIGYAAVYVKAENVEDARRIATLVVESDHWIILSLVQDGVSYNPMLHNLSLESELLLNGAQINGVAIGVAAVGFDPAGEGPKS